MVIGVPEEVGRSNHHSCGYSLSHDTRCRTPWHRDPYEIRRAVHDTIEAENASWIMQPAILAKNVAARPRDRGGHTGRVIVARVGAASSDGRSTSSDD